MKHRIWILTIGIVALLLTTGCQEREDTVNCKVFWQLYQEQKYSTPESIEKAFHDTFTDFWKNSPTYNSVTVNDISRSDVRSLTLKLSQMADQKVTEELDPTLEYDVRVKVFIDFNGSYIEEIWDKTYRRQL